MIREVSAGLLRFGLGVHEVTDGLAGHPGHPDAGLRHRRARRIVGAAVEIECRGQLDVHLEVLSGPAEPFGLPQGSTVRVPAPGFGASRTGRVWVGYTAGPDGAPAAGALTLRCRETAEQFEVRLTTTATAERPASARSAPG